MQFAGNFFDYDSAIADMAQEQGIGDVVNAMQTEAQEQAATAQAEHGAAVAENQANAENIDAKTAVEEGKHSLSKTKTERLKSVLNKLGAKRISKQAGNKK